jgi:hypothetical protein
VALAGDVKDRTYAAFRDAGGNLSKIAVVIEQDSPIPIEIADNIAQQIFKAEDRTRAFSWADFGTKTERVTTIIYTAPSVGVYTLTRTFSYTQVGSRYRLDSEGLVLS